MSTELLLVLFAGLGTIILGLITYYKNPKSATNKLFLTFSSILAAYVIVNFFATHQTTSDATFFFVKLIMTLAALINLFFYLLASTFPYTAITIPKRRLWLISGLTICLIILIHLNLVFTSVTLTPSGTNSLPGPAMPLFLLQTITFLSASFITIVQKYRRSQGVIKQQLKFLFIGTIFMFIAIIFTNLLLVLVFNNTGLINLLPLYIFSFVGLISFAIIKHRFLDITTLVFRTVTFTLLTLIIVAIYAGLLFSFLNPISEPYHTILSVILAVILVYSYNPLKSAIEKLTRNIFYRNPYSSSELLETLGEITRSTLSLHTLGKQTLFELTHTMHLSRAALIINQGDEPPQILHIGFIQKPEFTANTLHNLAGAAKGRLLIFDDLEESTEKMLLRQEQITVVMPLKVKNVNHGLVVLGEKASGEIYSQQDIDVLEILMPQLSVAIQNAKSYEEIKGFADTLKDEVNKATLDLKLANRHLKHLDKLKDEFVFIATHELKNPVTALRGYLSMLEEGIYGEIPAKMKDPFSQMQYSNQQLVDLVNDLLQIARAEAKTLTIATASVDIKQYVKEICTNLKPLADQKHLQLTYEQPKKDTLMVMTDEVRFKEVMNNLVSNAIKYSETGTITISHEFNEDKVITHVQDQGYGIADKDRAKIFTRFFRVEEEAAKGIPGTGLGLFIVKQIVEKMRGRIWFNSVRGKGTIFSFSLPKA